MKRTRAAVVSAAEPAVAVGLKKSPVPDDLENVSNQFLRSVKRLNKHQLQEISRKLGLSTEGKVPELKERILNHYARKNASLATDEKKAPGANEEKGEKTDTGDSKSANDASRISSSLLSEKSTTGGKKVVDGGMPSAKRKKWLVTDPAEIPPHYYHQDLFRANFPLIDVVEVPKGYRFPVRDKFEGAVLDEDVTLLARRKWISRLFDATDGYKVPENEKQAFPLHFAFLEPLKKLTRPSRADVEMQNRYCGKRKWRYEDVRDIGRPKIRKVEAEEHQGMYVVPDQEEVVEPLRANRSHCDYLGLVLAPEEAVELRGEIKEDEDVPSGFADGVLHIFADPVLDIGAGGDPDKVAGVLERKFAEDKMKWNARFQGGFYSVKHCFENLRKGHGGPIYVIVMTCSTWSYGILVPEGYVQIRNGSVASASMDLFRQHQSMTGQCSLDYEMLKEKLRTGTDFYRRCYRENPAAVYKDGPMLAGKFYLCSTWYNLPRAVAGGGKDEDGLRLFDGLLRLVIGDSVMDLSKEDFEARILLRKQMKKQRLDSWFS